MLFFPGLPKSSFPHSSGGTVWWETRTGCPALAMLCQPKRLPKHRGFSSQKVTVDSVDLQVYEIYELSRRRDVVWATFSFRFDNRPGVRLLSARPKAWGAWCAQKRMVSELQKERDVDGSHCHWLVNEIIYCMFNMAKQSFPAAFASLFSLLNGSTLGSPSPTNFREGRPCGPTIRPGRRNGRSHSPSWLQSWCLLWYFKSTFVETNVWFLEFRR